MMVQYHSLYALCFVLNAITLILPMRDYYICDRFYHDVVATSFWRVCLDILVFLGGMVVEEVMSLYALLLVCCCILYASEYVLCCPAWILWWMGLIYEVLVFCIIFGLWAWRSCVCHLQIFVVAG